MNKKLISLVLATVIALGIFVVSVVTYMNDDSKNDTASVGSSSTNSASTVESENSSTVGSEVTSSTDGESSQSTDSSKQESTASKPSSSNSSTTVDNPITNTLFPGYAYNTTLDIEDNVFLDALTYTGYNLQKHRDDGLLWTYILSKDKKWRGWLSDITYGGGCTGLEETADGLPNISRFEKGGLVCASFASYVYFNYLPNVAKIDTSSLDVPEKTYSAQSFYTAAKKWLEKGYTYNIGFTAKNSGSGIVFEPDEEIPIGSIIVFRDMDKPNRTQADHITIYVGKKNGYHWVIQTGNKNGPEFCAVERFKFGPGPQWPLKIFATPKCIYDAIGAGAK